jgi:TonB family protein
MRRLTGTLALLALCSSLSLAQRPEEGAPRFEAAEVVSTVEPGYPPNSIAAGTVILQVSLDRWGEIEAVKVLKDIKSLTPEAERAVRKWKFKPARLDGQPVKSTLAAAFTFRTIMY